MFVVFPPVLILTFRYLSGSSVLAVVGTYLIVVIMLAIVALMLLRYLRSFKKGWFESDEQAARLVGRDAIIASLTKISSLDPGLSSRKGGMIVPSPTERIQRLSQ
jgi:Zn-dependent protease with chaperone function